MNRIDNIGINYVMNSIEENPGSNVKALDYIAKISNNLANMKYKEIFINKFSETSKGKNCCNKKNNRLLVIFLDDLQRFLNKNIKHYENLFKVHEFLKGLSDIKTKWRSKEAAQREREVLAEWIQQNWNQIHIVAMDNNSLHNKLLKIDELFTSNTTESECTDILPKKPIDKSDALSFQKFGNNLASQLDSNKMNQNKTSNTIIEKKFSLPDAKQEFFTDIKNLKKENPQYYTLREKLEGKMFTLFKNCQSKDEALALFSEIAKDTDFVNLCQTDEIFASEALGKLYGPLEQDYQKGTTNPLMKDLFDKLKILNLLKKMQDSDNVGKHLKKEIANYLDSL